MWAGRTVDAFLVQCLAEDALLYTPGLKRVAGTRFSPLSMCLVLASCQRRQSPTNQQRAPENITSRLNLSPSIQPPPQGVNQNDRPTLPAHQALRARVQRIPIFTLLEQQGSQLPGDPLQRSLDPRLERPCSGSYLNGRQKRNVSSGGQETTKI